MTKLEQIEQADAEAAAAFKVLQDLRAQLSDYRNPPAELRVSIADAQDAYRKLSAVSNALYEASK
jgi:hypothetical protein